MQYGDIENLDSLREGAAKTDGVVHLAFNHDFSYFQKNCDDDRQAIEAIGEVLVGSNWPSVTAGTAIAANVDGKPSTRMANCLVEPARSRGSVGEGIDGAGREHFSGAASQVHDTRKQGLIPYVHAVARRRDIGVYRDGGNRWPARHISDGGTAVPAGD